MWTTEQIIALAPDASSAKNGRNLASAAKWQNSGKNERAVWGDCQGSGKNPYRTAIDLREPAFNCSCPSRKFPCKHALGLFLLFISQENLFAPENPPAFCAEWLKKRDAQKIKKEVKNGSELTEEEKEKREISKAKRAEEREKKVAEGLRELEIWLKDLVRQGLAAAKNQPASYFEKTAKRMIDAQAAGAARSVRELFGAVSQSENRAEDFLLKAGKIFLLVEGYKNFENLSEIIKADIKSSIGWTIKEDELDAAETVRDRWKILGQRNYEEEKLRVRRTWLFGENSRRSALILDFAFQNQPLDASLAVGTRIEAELVFYPGNFPLRAAIKNRGENLTHFTGFDGFQNFEEFLENYSKAVSRNLWLEVFPAALKSVIPVRRGEKAFLRDENEKLLPVQTNIQDFWNLISFSGGSEISVFGEWNGKSFCLLLASTKVRILVL